MTPPLMSSVMNADRLELAAAGSWTAANADRLERLVDAVAREAAHARSIVIDVASIEQAVEGGIDSSHVSWLHRANVVSDPLFKGAKGTNTTWVT
jgi:hypothetical protein